MKKIKSSLFSLIGILFLVSVGLHFNPIGQQEFLNTKAIAVLKAPLTESSGLCWVGDNLVSHNDSGNPAKLYVVNPENGEILRTVDIKGIRNKDWEDITVDSTYIYLGDFGNNKGNRKDLCIYKISIDQFNNTDAVDAEKIEIQYAEQTVYNTGAYKHNFDAESIVCIDESLYLFSKNWENGKTRVYEIPKTVGFHLIKHIKSFDTKGFVSGACYDFNTSQFVLCGYSMAEVFVAKIPFNRNTKEFGEMSRYELKHQGSGQIEAVCVAKNGNYILSSEKNKNKEAMLLELKAF